MSAPAPPMVVPLPRVAAHLAAARALLGDSPEVAAAMCACAPHDVEAAEAGEPLPVDALMDLCRRYRVPGGWVAISD